MVVRCARRAVAEWPGNGSRERAVARACGARELRSSTRRRRGREPRQAVLQRRRRPRRRGAEALALPRRPGVRAAAVCAPSSLCSSLHARRLVAPARGPRERPEQDRPGRDPWAAVLATQGSAFGLFALARLRAPAPRADMRGDVIASPLIESGSAAAPFARSRRRRGFVLVSGVLWQVCLEEHVAEQPRHAVLAEDRGEGVIRRDDRGLGAGALSLDEVIVVGFHAGVTELLR